MTGLPVSFPVVTRRFHVDRLKAPLQGGNCSQVQYQVLLTDLGP